MQSIKDLDTYGLVLWIGVFDGIGGFRPQRDTYESLVV